MRSCCITQGAKCGTLCQPRGVGWGGGLRGEVQEGEDMYPYGWFMLLYGRTQNNIVKQLSSN